MAILNSPPVWADPNAPGVWTRNSSFLSNEPLRNLRLTPQSPPQSMMVISNTNSFNQNFSFSVPNYPNILILDSEGFVFKGERFRMLEKPTEPGCR